MNNEPVVWMLTLPDGTHDWILDGNGCEGYIPLYTHSADLTDEEILFMCDDHRNKYGGIEPIGFARAILRKASEK